MAIRAGQIRKNSSESYITQISHSIDTFSSSGIGGTTFQDFAIYGDFQTDVTYYVRVLINRIDINKNMGDITGASDNDPHNLNIDIRLYQTYSENSSYQTIGEPILIQPYFNEDSATSLQNETAFMKWCAACIVDADPAMEDYPGAAVYYDVIKTLYDAKMSKEDGKQSDIRTPYQTVELIFTPYQNAKYLVFQLRRVTYDYTIEPRIVTIVGQEDDLTKRDVATVKNILTRAESNKVNKIGIQSRSGSLVVINKEPMRIGKSGTLEINNGISITSVGMVAPLNDVNDFILDYVYVT